MSEITKEHIDQFKQYFLSTEESVKAKLFTALSSADKERITIVETGFKNNISAAQIAAELNAPQFENVIKEIQTKYYSLLQEFEQDLAIAITQTERESLKKKLKAVDANEEVVFNNEIKTAITQVEREALKSQLSKVDEPTKVVGFNFSKFTKYAAAAVVISIISFVGVLLVNKNNNSTNQFDNLGFDNRNHQDKIIAKKIISINKNSSDSIFIIVNQIEFTKQLSELEQVIQESSGTGGRVKGVGPRIKAIKSEYNELKKEYDSLFQIGCTYSFNIKQKFLQLTIYDTSFNIDNLRFIRIGENFYINKSSSYYELKNSEKNIPLGLVNNPNNILELKKFSNLK